MSYLPQDVLTVSSATPSLGLGGVLGMAGHCGHVPVIREGHWVVVGRGLVNHDPVPVEEGTELHPSHLCQAMVFV